MDGFAVGLLLATWLIKIRICEMKGGPSYKIYFQKPRVAGGSGFMSGGSGGFGDGLTKSVWGLGSSRRGFASHASRLFLNASNSVVSLRRNEKGRPKHT